MIVIIIFESLRKNKGNEYFFLCFFNINDKIFLEFFMFKYLGVSRKVDVIKWYIMYFFVNIDCSNLYESLSFLVIDL